MNPERRRLTQSGRALAEETGKALKTLPFEAEKAIEEQLRADVQRAKKAVLTLSRGMIAAVMALHLLGTVVLGTVVFSAPFPYPVMYLVMGLLLWLVLALRYTAWAARRRFSATLLLVTNLGLNAFWLLVLVDQVPARPVVLERLQSRPETPALWVPIGCYAVAMALTLGHAILRWSAPKHD